MLIIEEIVLCTCHIKYRPRSDVHVRTERENMQRDLFVSLLFHLFFYKNIFNFLTPIYLSRDFGKFIRKVKICNG